MKYLSLAVDISLIATPLVLYWTQSMAVALVMMGLGILRIVLSIRARNYEG